MGGLPVIVMGHQNNVDAIYSRTHGFSRIHMGRLTDVLTGNILLSPWLNKYPTK